MLAVRILWWLAPRVCYMARLIIGTLGGLMRWFGSLPGRFRSRFWANAGVYEEIPMSTFNNEAMLPNSPIVGIDQYDRCIFKVYIIDSDFPDKLHFSGLGFWSNSGETVENTDGLFMTAAHVLPETGNIMLKSANREDMEYTMAVSQWTKMEDYDVAYFKPPQRITTTLGLRKAKVMKTILKQSVIVTVYGRQVSSCGPLKPMEKTVFVSYEGSSVGGFSGSPYMSGKTVCGLHIGSSKENGMGIDSAFLSMKLAKNFRLESSEDYIYDEIHKAMDEGRELEWSQYGLDDVVIHIKGRDFFVDYYEFQDMMDLAKKSRRKGKKGRWEEECVKEAFSDVDGLPKNCFAPTPALVVGATRVQDAPSQPNPKLSKLSSLPEAKVDLTGQPSTVAQLNEVLQSMSKSLNDLSKKLDNHDRVIGKLSSRVYGAVPKKPGKAELAQPKA
nr:MAG: RNA-dependent RNA polymerase [Riboviria sp.]